MAPQRPRGLARKIRRQAAIRKLRFTSAEAMKTDLMTTPSKPIKVLHVVGSLNAGGIENWLMSILRGIDRGKFKFDFLTHTAKPGFFDEEARLLGCSILPCPYIAQPWRYVPSFLRILSQSGPYDIVHSHVHHFSGLTLMLARCAGVPLRIAHSHIDTSEVDTHTGVLRRWYLRLAALSIQWNAHIRLACSREAASALFRRQPQVRLLHYGVDPAKFAEPIERKKVRSEFGVPKEALVVGHVGRFARQKNHAFLISAFAEAARREPRLLLLLVGAGPLQEAVERQVAAMKLERKVIFAGLRGDVPRVMRGVMDCFVLPSHYEGLPVVLLEAQAAGLPCIISEAISDESTAIPDLVARLPVVHPAQWAEGMIDAAKRRVESAAALQAVDRAHLTLPHSLNALTFCYAGEKSCHSHRQWAMSR